MSQDNMTDLQKIMKERNEDERKVNKWKDWDKMDKMDECSTSEEWLHENEEEWEKKDGSDEVKEKKNIDNGECTNRGAVDGEIGERNNNDQDEVDLEDRKMEKWAKCIVQEEMMKIKGTFLKIWIEIQSKNVGVECVDAMMQMQMWKKILKSQWHM